MTFGYIEGDYLYFDAPDADTASEICKSWDNTELEYDDLQIIMSPDSQNPCKVNVSADETEFGSYLDEELTGVADWLKNNYNIVLKGYLFINVDGDVSRGEFVNGVLAWEDIYWLQHHKVPVIRKLRRLGEALDRYNNHSKCPNCGNEDIDWDIAEQEGDCYWQKGECTTCDCVFNEVWSMVLSDIEILERGELNFDDITTAEYIDLFNLMNNRYTQGNRLVFPNTNGAITNEFKDFKDFAARACKGDYHPGDSWCQINAHGNIITFTELEDSEINVLHIKEWLERSQENRDLANTKLGKKRF